jgi:DNA-directed RNA polymerase subunit RPC12/RpoP
MGPFGKKKKKSFEEEQMSRGLIKYGDEWITPAEKFRRERLTGTNMPIVREKETIISKEIVKIRCQYCGTAYNIAESDRCPYCGGK